MFTRGLGADDTGLTGQQYLWEMGKRPVTQVACFKWPHDGSSSCGLPEIKLANANKLRMHGSVQQGKISLAALA
jgi:hypothetical protein